MTTLAALGDQIRSARAGRGLSQSQLATAAGIHRNTVLRLEKGDGNTRAGVMLAVCEVLGLELALLNKSIASLEAADSAVELTQSQADSSSLMGTSQPRSKGR